MYKCIAATSFLQVPFDNFFFPICVRASMNLLHNLTFSVCTHNVKLLISSQYVIVSSAEYNLHAGGWEQNNMLHFDLGGITTHTAPPTKSPWILVHVPRALIAPKEHSRGSFTNWPAPWTHFQSPRLSTHRRSSGKERGRRRGAEAPITIEILKFWVP